MVKLSKFKQKVHSISIKGRGGKFDHIYVLDEKGKLCFPSQLERPNKPEPSYSKNETAMVFNHNNSVSELGIPDYEFMNDTNEDFDCQIVNFQFQIDNEYICSPNRFHNVRDFLDDPFLI